MGALYDRADIYGLLDSEGRFAFEREQWSGFLGDRSIQSLLDVSIGSGSMTLPLQGLGIALCGSDLSESMLASCRAKADSAGISIALKRCDFRDLSPWGERLFDCVASTGNALGHVPNGDVLTALEQMDAHVRPGGYLYLDSRNWEKIQREKQRFYLYPPFFRDGTRINLVQVWDHHPDGRITFNLLFTFEREGRILQKEIFQEEYFPFPLELIREKLLALGYGPAEWAPYPAAWQKDFSKTEWYRLVARKGSGGANSRP